jgi:hypothetical protein
LVRRGECRCPPAGFSHFYEPTAVLVNLNEVASGMLTVFKAEFFPEVEPEAEARREMIDAQMASEVGVKLN